NPAYHKQKPQRSDFFFSSRRRHTRCLSDWSSDVCSSDLVHKKLPLSVGDDLDSARFNSDLRTLQYAATCVGDAAADSSPAFCLRSEERRVGKECKSRGSQKVQRNNNTSTNEETKARE